VVAWLIRDGRCAKELLLEDGVILVLLLELDSGRGEALGRLDAKLLSSMLNAEAGLN
jgi:hypothetical protein